MCDASGARLVDSQNGVDVGSKTMDGRTSIKLATPRAEYGWIPLGLRGAHQIPNALVAARLLEELGRTLPIGPQAIVAGLRDVRWPGRLQLIETAEGRRVLLDAAHNPAGASALAAYLKREFPEPIPFVFGAMRTAVRERAFTVPGAAVEIVPAVLGDDVGLVGSALMARERVAGRQPLG